MYKTFTYSTRSSQQLQHAPSLPQSRIPKSCRCISFYHHTACGISCYRSHKRQDYIIRPQLDDDPAPRSTKPCITPITKERSPPKVRPVTFPNTPVDEEANSQPTRAPTSIERIDSIPHPSPTECPRNEIVVLNKTN